MKTVTIKNMRYVENTAFENGISFEDMIISAGTSAGKIISKSLYGGETVLVLCGKGRNGSDGIVAGNYLQKRGHKVYLALPLGEPKDEICRKIIDEFAGDFERADCNNFPAGIDVVIDAVFGIGFSGTLSDELCTVFDAVNELGAEIFSIDIPSGVGTEHSLRATKTTAMFALKPENIVYHTLCGEIEVADIGVGDPKSYKVFEKYDVYSKEEIKKMLVTPSIAANKGNFGKVLTVCGSENMVGASYFVNQAAIEAGAGLVKAAFPDGLYLPLTSRLNECLFYPLEENSDGGISSKNTERLEQLLSDSTSVVVGPGMGNTSDTKAIVKFIVENSTVPVILDADALNALSGDVDILKHAKGKIIVTPHPGEMSRLNGMSIAEIQKNRIAVAVEFSKKYSVVTVLKGANTVIADETGRIAINITGNPGMARGGSGDVLAGIIAALIKRTSSVYDAAAAGVFIHGLAGDIVMSEKGQISVTPTRLLSKIGEAMS